MAPTRRSARVQDKVATQIAANSSASQEPAGDDPSKNSTNIGQSPVDEDALLKPLSKDEDRHTDNEHLFEMYSTEALLTGSVVHPSRLLTGTILLRFAARFTNDELRSIFTVLYQKFGDDGRFMGGNLSHWIGAGLDCRLSNFKTHLALTARMKAFKEYRDNFIKTRPRKKCNSPGKQEIAMYLKKLESIPDGSLGLPRSRRPAAETAKGHNQSTSQSRGPLPNPKDKRTFELTENNIDSTNTAVDALDPPEEVHQAVTDDQERLVEALRRHIQVLNDENLKLKSQVSRNEARTNADVPARDSKPLMMELNKDIDRVFQEAVRWLSCTDSKSLVLDAIDASEEAIAELYRRVFGQETMVEHLAKLTGKAKVADVVCTLINARVVKFLDEPNCLDCRNYLLPFIDKLREDRVLEHADSRLQGTSLTFDDLRCELYRERLMLMFEPTPLVDEEAIQTRKLAFDTTEHLGEKLRVHAQQIAGSHDRHFDKHERPFQSLDGAFFDALKLRYRISSYDFGVKYIYHAPGEAFDEQTMVANPGSRGTVVLLTMRPGVHIFREGKGDFVSKATVVLTEGF